jgi:hypothetical protein
MKRYTQLILNNTDSHHFRVSVHEKDRDDVKYKLYCSKVGAWLGKQRGKVVARLKDDGDGVLVLMEDKQVQLDYCEAQELYILLRTFFKHTPNNTDNLRYLKKREVK